MVSGLLARSNAARALRSTNRVGLGPKGFPMNADDVMRAVEEVRGAADAGAAAWLELEQENERLRAENARLREATNG